VPPTRLRRGCHHRRAGLAPSQARRHASAETRRLCRARQPGRRRRQTRPDRRGRVLARDEGTTSPRALPPCRRRGRRRRAAGPSGHESPHDQSGTSRQAGCPAGHACRPPVRAATTSGGGGGWPAPSPRRQAATTSRPRPPRPPSQPSSNPSSTMCPATCLSTQYRVYITHAARGERVTLNGAPQPFTRRRPRFSGNDRCRRPRARARDLVRRRDRLPRRGLARFVDGARKRSSRPRLKIRPSPSHRAEKVRPCALVSTIIGTSGDSDDQMRVLGPEPSLWVGRRPTKAERDALLARSIGRGLVYGRGGGLVLCCAVPTPTAIVPLSSLPRVSPDQAGRGDTTRRGRHHHAKRVESSVQDACASR